MASVKRRKLSPPLHLHRDSPDHTLDGSYDTGQLSMKAKAPPDPFARGGIRRSPLRRPTPVAEDEVGRSVSTPQTEGGKTSTETRVQHEGTELQLPPTPTQLGIEDPLVTNPPRGLMHTPSKRPKRRLHEGTISSDSPSKFARFGTARAAKRQDVDLASVQLPVLIFSKPTALSNRSESADESCRALKSRVQELQQSIQLLEQELRFANNLPHATDEPPDNSLEILLEATSHVNNDDRVSEVAATSTSVIISSFLPFHSRRYGEQEIRHKKLQDEMQLPRNKLNTVSDPTVCLPLDLRLYRALTNSAARESRVGSPYQYMIKLSSQARIFEVVFSLRTDADVKTILGLKLVSISTWARAELQAYIDKQSSSQAPDLLCWTCGQYYDMALHRAAVWSRLSAEVATRARLLPAIGSLETQRSNHWRPTRRNIYPYLGRQRLRLDYDLGLATAGKNRRWLIFTWTIKFDRCGQVIGECRCSLGLSDQACHPEIKTTLRTMSTMYSEMCKEVGVYEASLMMIELLFKNEQAL